MLGGVGLYLSGPLQSCLFDFVGGLAWLISAFITDAIGSKYMFSFSCLGLHFGLLMYAFTFMDRKNDCPIFFFFFFTSLKKHHENDVMKNQCESWKY